MDELVLISHVLCPYVQRVAIALHEKGAAFLKTIVPSPYRVNAGACVARNAGMTNPPPSSKRLSP